ncbi:MAG: hypothetical protein LBD18_06490, partial [Treponema sp.]|nr:hypothetical protein [Treponema sp.]
LDKKHRITRIFGTKTLLIRENPWIFPLSIFISPFNQRFPKGRLLFFAYRGIYWRYTVLTLFNYAP